MSKKNKIGTVETRSQAQLCCPSCQSDRIINDQETGPGINMAPNPFKCKTCQCRFWAEQVRGRWNYLGRVEFLQSPEKLRPEDFMLCPACGTSRVKELENQEPFCRRIRSYQCKACRTRFVAHYNVTVWAVETISKDGVYQDLVGGDRK